MYICVCVRACVGGWGGGCRVNERSADRLKAREANLEGRLSPRYDYK